MRDDVRRDWEWADRFWDTGILVLEENADLFVQFKRAPMERDWKECVDIEAMQIRKDIGFRVRAPGIKERYGDITFRSFRERGGKTELEKIREGWGQVFLYCWVMPDDTLDWLLLDLNRARKAKLFDIERKQISNPDNETRFTAFSIGLFRYHKCILREGWNRHVSAT